MVFLPLPLPGFSCGCLIALDLDIAYACLSASSQYPSNICQRLSILIKQNSVIKQSISERVLPKKRFYENRQTSSKSHKVAQNLLIFARESRFCQISKNKKFSHFLLFSRSNIIHKQPNCTKYVLGRYLL